MVNEVQSPPDIHVETTAHEGEPDAEEQSTTHDNDVIQDERSLGRDNYTQSVRILQEQYQKQHEQIFNFMKESAENTKMVLFVMKDLVQQRNRG